MASKRKQQPDLARQPKTEGTAESMERDQLKDPSATGGKRGSDELRDLGHPDSPHPDK